MKLLHRLHFFLLITLSWSANAAQEYSAQPLNLVLINHHECAESDNGAMAIRICDGIADTNPCFAMLFDKSLIGGKGVFSAMNSRCASWNHYIHPQTNLALCVPKRESRSVGELGFIQDDWQGPLTPYQLYKFPSTCNAVGCFDKTFEMVLRTEGQRPALNVMLAGHGLPGSRKAHRLEAQLGPIAYLNTHAFQGLLMVLQRANTQFLAIDTCYGGGINLLASVNATSKPPFPIVVFSVGDVVSYADSSLSSGRLFSGLNRLPKNFTSPDAQHEAIESAIRGSCIKVPRIENIPVVYIPGRPFYEPLALNSHVIIGSESAGEITVPRGTQALVVQAPLFSGTVSDSCNSAGTPVISRIPGNAIHYIDSYVNKQVPMSALIRSFLPTSYCELRDGSLYNALKLWLINRLEASDGRFKQCALFFNGFKSSVTVVTKFSGAYGMVKLPAKNAECSPCNFACQKMGLSSEQYCCLVRYLCRKAQIHPELANLLQLPATNPTEISALFLQNQQINVDCIKESEVLDARSIMHQRLIQEFMQQARQIKNLQATCQYHKLWHAYNDLAPIALDHTLKKLWPICAEKLMGENIIELLFYLAQDFFEEKSIQEILQKISRQSVGGLHGSSDPFELLSQVVQTEAQKKQFEQAMGQLIKERRYERIFTLLSYLIPDSEMRSSRDNFLLWESSALRRRRTFIINSINNNPDLSAAFVAIIKSSFNDEAFFDNPPIESAKAKLLLHYLFMSDDSGIQQLPLPVLEAIINGLKNEALTQDEAYFKACAKKLLKGPEEAFFVASVIVKRLVQIRSCCFDLINMLPPSLRPLSYRLRWVDGISGAEEQKAFGEFKVVLEKSPDEAIDILLQVVPWLSFDIWSVDLNRRRINALVRVVAESCDLESFISRISRGVCGARREQAVRELIRVLSDAVPCLKTV